MKANLLVELLTEELPPKALEYLGNAFGHQVQDWLIRAQLKMRDPRGTRIFATPRRLAVLIRNVSPNASDRAESKKLMPSKVAFDANNNPSAALAKRLEKEGASADQVERKFDGNTEYAFLNQTIPGLTLSAGLQIALKETISKLPIPKMMGYQLADGTTTVQFVRPAHKLLALHGDRIVDVSILGLNSGRVTRGHRFLTSSPINIKNADDYERVLREEGKVEANFEVRRSRIIEELKRAEKELAIEMAALPNGRVPINVERLVIHTEGENPGHLFSQTIDNDAVERALDCSGGTELLDEVTALVEWPRAYWGHFDERFLEVPVECIALTMKHNQKYFPVFDASARLLPYFVVISNNDETLAAKEAQQQIRKNIVSGNERVLRPRLADAKFFYDQDRKTRLEDRVPHLAQVVFHNKLGNQRERTDRIKLLAGRIAHDLGANRAIAERAAELSKADLLTEMVGEFPELQGIMGRCYALHDGESMLVADAIEQHYWPKFAEDRLPRGIAASSVALADRLDALVGFFGINQIPTGDRDPLGLRRQALAVIRILMDMDRPASLPTMLGWARDNFSSMVFSSDVVERVHAFVVERLRNYEILQKAFPQESIEAIVSQNPARLDTVVPRLRALDKFRELPESAQLASANKRTKNILSKANYRNPSAQPDLARATERAEIKLINVLQELAHQIDSVLADAQDEDAYVHALRSLATLREPIDTFFDEVMVMVEDADVRENRLAILQRLSDLMNRVADISKLAA